MKGISVIQTQCTHPLTQLHTHFRYDRFKCEEKHVKDMQLLYSFYILYVQCLTHVSIVLQTQVRPPEMRGEARQGHAAPVYYLHPVFFLYPAQCLTNVSIALHTQVRPPEM